MSNVEFGAISGALDPDSEQAQEHAVRYYELVRRMKTDVERISTNTGYSQETIAEVKQFVFIERHALGGQEKERFFPSYEMAESWQRLIDGRDIQPHDLTLLKHEIMERKLMSEGMPQDIAHIRTSQLFNYAREAKQYYDQIKKHP